MEEAMKTAGRDFMKATYYEQISESPQDQGEPQPPLELPLPPEAALIPLPAPAELHLPEIELRDAIERRRSVRRYKKQALTLAELSYLLWLTQGVKETSKRPATLRTVPSAGARHAFETYLLINIVEGLEPSLYRFAASQHALLRLESSSNIREDITSACFDQRQVFESAATFIWVAVTERMTWRYVERGYRYLHLDAGHVCQNLYLAAEAIDCGVCAIAAFDDEKIHSALDVDGENLFVIYLASLGKVNHK
jgi:SagB-type dehydrogenase family enzyme